MTEKLPFSFTRSEQLMNRTCWGSSSSFWHVSPDSGTAEGVRLFLGNTSDQLWSQRFSGENDTRKQGSIELKAQLFLRQPACQLWYLCIYLHYLLPGSPYTILLSHCRFLYTTVINLMLLPLQLTAVLTVLLLIFFCFFIVNYCSFILISMLYDFYCKLFGIVKIEDQLINK